MYHIERSKLPSRNGRAIGNYSRADQTCNPQRGEPNEEECFPPHSTAPHVSQDADTQSARSSGLSSTNEHYGSLDWVALQTGGEGAELNRSLEVGGADAGPYCGNRSKKGRRWGIYRFGYNDGGMMDWGIQGRWVEDINDFLKRKRIWETERAERETGSLRKEHLNHNLVGLSFLRVWSK